MRFKNNYLFNYLQKAPGALAVERSLECEIMCRQKFPRPILDIGCGDGLFAFILFDEKIDVGVDPNAKELKCAARYESYERLINCSGERIPLEAETFNTIYSNSVLEHIPDIESVLQEAHRLLSNDGIMYVTVPTDLFDQYSNIYWILSKCRLDTFAENYRRFFNRFWKHYHYYCPDTWAKLFEKNSFRVIASQEYCSKQVCLLNDLFTPLAVISLLTKKAFNRWFFFERLRKFTSRLPHFLLSNWIKRQASAKNGGIIFFAMEKN